MVVGVATVLEAVAWLMWVDRAPMSLAGSLSILACGTTLIAGFLTPGSAACVAIAGIAMLSTDALPPGGPLSTPVSVVLVVADAVAVVLLGPGAFSLDARLFGRREILIAHDSTKMA